MMTAHMPNQFRHAARNPASEAASAAAVGSRTAPASPQKRPTGPAWQVVANGSRPPDGSLLQVGGQAQARSHGSRVYPPAGDTRGAARAGAADTATASARPAPARLQNRLAGPRRQHAANGTHQPDGSQHQVRGAVATPAGPGCKDTQASAGQRRERGHSGSRRARSRPQYQLGVHQTTGSKHRYTDDP
jgi:hypothetical protein